MAFTIPNEADAYNAKQAEIDKVDFDIVGDSIRQRGISDHFYGECLVEPLATPGLAVKVGSGAIRTDRTLVDVTGVASLGIATANGSLNRFDLVCVNNVGSCFVTSGTNATAPVFPSIPNSSTVVAAVYVPASCQATSAALITDKRMLIHNAPYEWTIFAVGSSNQVWTNMPSALTELLGLTRFRTYQDLRNYAQWRMLVCVATSAAHAASQIGLQWSAQQNSWYGLDNNTGDAMSTARCACGSGTNRIYVGSWGGICDSAWYGGDGVYLRAVTHSGDGALDPAFSSIRVQFR